MTALKKYARLEAAGLWRPDPETQRREVVVSIGEATLILSDLNDRPITHWSLAAIERKGSGAPAVFYPDGDPDETLELPATERHMIEAIEKLRRAISRQRPHPGRLRWMGAIVSVAAVAALGFLWLPNALREHSLRVLPEVKRAEIGGDLLRRIGRVGGAPCRAPGTDRALRMLASRTGISQIAVLPGATRDALYVPGGTVILSRRLFEDYEDPAVAAGFILAEKTRERLSPSLHSVLDMAGIRGMATLLTTGQLPDAALDAYVEYALAAGTDLPPFDALLDAFSAASISAKPYAYAIDISGETTLPLIESDPVPVPSVQPLMQDADWVRLQAICELS